MKYIIGVDLGGTKINTILLNKNAKISRKIKFPTKAGRGKNNVIERILETIKFVSLGVDKRNILGVSIGVPGVLDKKREEILNLPNLPGWKNIKLKGLIKKNTGFLVLMENDSNCMALAESKFGAGKNIKNLVCLNILPTTLRHFCFAKPIASMLCCSKYSQELNSRLKLRSVTLRYALHFIQGKFFTL